MSRRLHFIKGRCLDRFLEVARLVSGRRSNVHVQDHRVLGYIIGGAQRVFWVRPPLELTSVPDNLITRDRLIRFDDV